MPRPDPPHGETRRLRAWVRRLTARLAGGGAHPARVEAHLGRGLQLELWGPDAGEATARLGVCLFPASADQAAYLRTAVTALRFLGEDQPAGPAQGWLEGIAAALPAVESRPGWREYLDLAWRRPPGTQAAGPEHGQRMTSGHELQLRVITRCNARCAFCQSLGQPPDLVTEAAAIRARIAASAARGARRVVFTGGEPTLRRDLGSLVRFAREQGASVNLQTNGLLLARPGRAQALADAGLESIFLALHSATPAVHDAMLCVRGAHARALAAARACQAAGIQVGVNCVLTTRNQGGLARLVELLTERLAPRGLHLCLSFVAPEGGALEHLELMPRLREAADEMAGALDLGAARGLTVRIPGLCGIPLCLLPGREEAFDEYRDSRPPRLVTRTQPAACAACGLRDRCSGFWRAYLERFGAAELVPRLAPT
ncbi:MAG TPA: radical SAM protein [Myxococcota bacterium]|nr:radical SAM protein [Myxococcota bacterium]HRY92491.1 radical SAM protein [Myxococcota bacterium]